MALFPILLPILAAILAYALFSQPRPELAPIRTDAQVRNPLIKTVFFFVPLYALRLLFEFYNDFSYDPGGLYGLYFVQDYFGLFLILTFMSLYFNRRIRATDPREAFVPHLIVFTTTLSLLGACDAVFGDSYWTLYELFFRPISYAIALLVLPFAIAMIVTDRGRLRALGYVIAFPVLFPFIAMWADWLRPGLAALTLGAIVLACAAFLFGEVRLFRPAARYRRAREPQNDAAPSFSEE